MKVSILTPPIPSVGSGVGRSGGVHLTQIVWDLGVRMGVCKESPDEPAGGGWDGECLREVGFMFEDALEQVWKGRQGVRPGEVEVDGVSMSADGVAWDEGTGEPVLHEYKCTWKSMGKLETLIQRAGDAPEWWYYMTQVKAYCHGWGARVAVMHFLFVMGDYREARGPRYREYRFEFEPWELEENWRMVVNHGRTMGLLK